jgi:hypothetical protein
MTPSLFEQRRNHNLLKSFKLFFGQALRPEHYGIEVGAFADPDFPPPVYSVWEETRTYLKIAEQSRSAINVG